MANSVFDVGRLAEPATTLINRVSDAVGGIARPWQIRRIAAAESDARIVDAKASIEISELERRAILRLAREEGQCQENIENITYIAASRLSANAKPDHISTDWLRNFYRNARHISSNELQQIWAAVLTKKAEDASEFSTLTLDILAKIDRHDVDAFERVCSFIWQFNEAIPYIFSFTDQIYTENGIDFSTLVNLEKAGLISFFPTSHLFASLDAMPFVARYNEKHLTLGGNFSSVHIDETGFSVGSGHVLLTRAGHQLSTICASTEIAGFFEYASGKLSQGRPLQILSI